MKLRILMVSAEYPPQLSGIADYVGHLVGSLKSQGLDLAITQNITCWDQKAWPLICSQIENFKPHILHLQYMTTAFQNRIFITFLPGKIKSSFSALPVVTTYHEFAAPVKRAALLPLLLGSDAHIVTNDHHFRWLQRLKRILFLKSPAVRIPLAANVLPGEFPADRESVRRGLGIKPGETLLVRFGILHDISAPSILCMLNVLRRLREQGKSVKLLLIGKKEERAGEKISESISSNRVSDAVMVKANLQPAEISRLLFASDIGLALYPDGVSEKRTALLSLLAHGLPVIGTRKGMLPSEFRDEENILCVPAEADEESWGRAIQRLLSDDILCHRLSAGAGQIARLHDWNEIGRQTSDLYHKLMRKDPR